jgi:glycerol-1-phosphatase
VFDGALAAEAAFRRYEAVRSRLPLAGFPTTSRHLAHLGQAADHYDGFILDAFGVLNVGETAIPGAVARMADLRARSKRLVVLTNAASYTRAQILAKYHRLGFDFTPDEVVSSRDVAVARLETVAPGATWAAISSAPDTFDDIPARVVDAVADPAAFDHADAILFLSTGRWTPALQRQLQQALERRPRPFVVANPDIVAPRETGLSQEPGLFTHDLIDALGCSVHWFGKPFADGFTDAIARAGLPAQRLAMVGDTLHTDVLGGAAAGCGTVLITDHGLFRGLDVAPFIAVSGIVPDIIIPTT